MVFALFSAAEKGGLVDTGDLIVVADIFETSKMSGGMLYGGDEIGALVFDLGHHSLRVGYAQEDTPKAEIPAVVGIGEDGNCTASKTEPMDIDDKKPDNNITQSGTKYYIDTTILHVPRKNMEVVSYMKDGMIEDWDHFEKV